MRSHAHRSLRIALALAGILMLSACHDMNRLEVLLLFRPSAGQAAVDCVSAGVEAIRYTLRDNAPKSVGTQKMLTCAGPDSVQFSGFPDGTYALVAQGLIGMSVCYQTGTGLDFEGGETIELRLVAEPTIDCPLEQLDAGVDDSDAGEDAGEPDADAGPSSDDASESDADAGEPPDADAGEPPDAAEPPPDAAGECGDRNQPCCAGGTCNTPFSCVPTTQICELG